MEGAVDLRSRYLSHKVWPLLLLTPVLIVVPIFFGTDFLLELLLTAFLYAVIVMCWSLVLGYAGIFSFASLALFAVGGYAAGFMSKDYGIPPVISLVLGAFVTLITGIAVGASVIRLKGFLVGLCTFSFQFLLQAVIIGFVQYTGGTNGLRPIPPLILGISRSQSVVLDYVLASAIMIVTLFLLTKVSRSMFGVAIRAYRDNEDYAEALGLYPAGLKVRVFIYTSFILGFAGAFYAHHYGMMAPTVLSFDLFALLVVSLTLAGLDSIYGACLSTIVVTIVYEVLREMFPGVHVIVLGVLIMVSMLISFTKLKEYFQNTLGRVSAWSKATNPPAS